MVDLSTGPRPARTPGGLAAPLVAPDTVETLAAFLRDTDPAAHLAIVGAGSWPGVMPEVPAAARVSVAGLRGIVEYTPGDLTLTALAGTSLAELRDVTTREGQWLPLDPFGSSQGTLGATLATASCGPCAGSIGHPRDLTLGLEVVDGRGTRVRAGGRVVKNVAGFDLVRLQVGACGTLGILTEATVRLRPRPPRDASLFLAGDMPVTRLAEVLRTIRALPLTPVATEVLNAPLARRLGLTGGGIMLRLVGHDRAVEAARDTVQRTTPLDELAAAVWDDLARCEPADSAVVRYGISPPHVPGLWRACTEVASAEVLMHATPARGIVRIIAPADEQVRIARAASGLAGSAIAERGVFLRTTPPLPPALTRMSRQLRTAFDPHRRLNPGVFADLDD